MDRKDSNRFSDDALDEINAKKVVWQQQRQAILDEASAHEIDAFDLHRTADILGKMIDAAEEVDNRPKAASQEARPAAVADQLASAGPTRY